MCGDAIDVGGHAIGPAQSGARLISLANHERLLLDVILATMATWTVWTISAQVPLRCMQVAPRLLHAGGNSRAAPEASMWSRDPNPSLERDNIIDSAAKGVRDVGDVGLGMSGSVAACSDTLRPPCG